MVGRAINECLSHLILNVGIFLIGLFVDRFELSNTRFELLILVLESTTVPTVPLSLLLKCRKTQASVQSSVVAHNR